MPRLYPTNVLIQAQEVLSVWNRVGATVTLGTLLPATLTADITAGTALESQITDLEAQLTDAVTSVMLSMMACGISSREFVMVRKPITGMTYPSMKCLAEHVEANGKRPPAKL